MINRRRLSWIKQLFRSALLGYGRPIRSRVPGIGKPGVELLEGRILPSGIAPLLNIQEFHDPSRIPAGLTPSALGILPKDNGSDIPLGYTPDQLRTAYGIDNIMFGSVTGDGTGQTIAIVDAYDDPSFVDSTASNFATSDLAQFDSQLGITSPPSFTFTKVNQSGQAGPLPGTDPAGAGNANGNWEIEEALDIEWAHAMAPGANIVLVEATDDSNANLFAAVAEAASLPGVSAVSMSWGTPEYTGENAQDSTFVTPAGHQGVTFLAASGDNGGFSYDAQGNPNTTPGILYPAASPNVVAVGGTTLQVNADNTYNSETAWSGSGGGTSIYETQPAYQQGFQNTGFRTIPDVAFDADPNTGVSVYDSYNDTDGSGAWVVIGGTSLASPSWAGLIAIVNQGRVLAGGTTLDGPTQTLPALYSLSPTDFNDITTGSNGVFSAGPGYDEVTGLGSPKAAAVTADLATYGTASQIAVTAQPPSSVIVGDSFGVVVAAENSLGQVDPAFNGTLTIALAGGPAGATLGGNLTATAVHGIAVFDGLTINQLGSGYTLTISSSQFPSITTNSFAEITNLTPWQGTYYPVPTDASLRAAINAADSNAFAFNTILLSASTTLLSNTTAGALLIQNTSSLPGKTLTITGQGSTSSIIGSVYNWQDGIFQIVGSAGQALNVTLQGLTIQGGNAESGGVLGGTDALGGGLLIDDAAVTLANDVVQNNQAQGDLGVAGKAGAVGKAGAAGGNGKNAAGGGIYVASGTLSLFNDTISGNSARGGKGGEGGEGGGQGTKSAAAVTAGQGGSGGMGGSAAGGGIYAAGGSVQLENDTFRSNQAIGGPGGTGGTGGSGGHGKPGVQGKPGGIGGAGGLGGAAAGGGLYLGGGSLTLVGGSLQKNAAVGGAGGQGGAGGAGTIAGSSLTQILGGSGSSLSGLLGGLGGSGQGGSGGAGGQAGAAGLGAGGGVYVAAGSLTLVNATVAGNQAAGGQGGLGGQGGTGGFGASAGGTGFFSLPAGLPAGHGGAGGNGSLGQGGGILVAGGTVVLSADTWNGNIAAGGKGGMGGQGGNGPLAALGTGSSLGFGSSLSGSSFPSLTGGLGGGNSAGAGGNGGKGGNGNGGGLYVSGGALTLTNNTVADNTAAAGAIGAAGTGGLGANGQVTGAAGTPGPAGASSGSGLYVTGGAVSLDNSTVALNVQTGSGSGGGVVQSAGTVTAVSTLFAGNGPVDYSGAITATDSLFQTAPVNGTLSGSGNLVNVNPLLDPNGLQNHGGPTQTIALQALSPAIGAGANPENLFTDQRGYAPRTGPGGTDIGAYQTSATADAQAPTATLQATAVTGANASAFNPYTFTITYSDNGAVALASLPGAIVQVLPPGSAAPILASVESTVAGGWSDGIGNAQSFIVTYQITPPGGAWTSADIGVYTITLGGAPVIDLAGNAVATGTLGTFSVSLGLTPGTVSASAVQAGSSANLTATFTDANTAAPTSDFSGTINWGDGTVANPDITTFGSTAVSGGGGSYTVSSSHPYTLANTYAVSVTITDVGGSSVTENGTLTVNAAVMLSPGTLPGGTVNAPYNQTITTSGGTGAVTLVTNITNAIAGLTMPASGTGSLAITGTPTATGTETFTVTATDSLGVATTTNYSIQVTSQPATQFLVTASSSAVAGQAFVYTVQAEDSSGAPTSFSGPVSFTTNDSQVATLPAGTLNSSGFGYFIATLKTATATGWTITATAGTISGQSSGITVTPGAATHFVVTAPSSTLTLNSTSFTVTAYDPYNNVATGYSGTVHFTSSDGAVSAGSGLPLNSTLVSGTGTFTVTLKTPGNQRITATDASNSTIVGNSNAIATRGLYVTNFATTPNGFTATFSKVVNLTTFDYYRFSASQSQAPDVAMATVGSATTNVNGTLLVSSTATQTTITFVATQGVLTNAANYFVTLTSGAGGIVDTSGEQLAGDANGFLPGTNYVATNLVPASSTTPTLSIPGFARGPNSSANVQITTNSVSAAGIPITLTHAPANTTEVQFTLDFNPALLNVTGPTSGTFTLLNPGTANSTGVANFEYSGSALSTTSAVLGDIVADVPNSAANQMLQKTLLDLPAADIYFNGSVTPASPVQNADGVQVVDYLGETTNNFGVINSVDASNAQAVVTANTTPSAANQPAGLQAFPLADPFLIAGSTGSTTFKVVAADVTGLNRFAVSLSHPFIPTPPTGLTYSSPGPDPTVSLPTNLQVTAGGIVTVPVNIDDPRPAGSDGMTQAELALTYDPSVFSLTSADVQLGTVPASGTGWTLTTQINPLTGQIAILLESQTPTRSAEGGSLVSIDFHVNPGATLGATPVNLAASVNPTGNATVWTRLFDSQQEFTLSPAPSNAVSAAGMDAMVVVTPADAGTAEGGVGSNLGAPAEIGSVISAAPTLLPELTAAVAPVVVPEEDKQRIAAAVDESVAEGQTVHASGSADRTGSSVLEAVPFSANAGTTVASATSGLMLPLSNTAASPAAVAAAFAVESENAPLAENWLVGAEQGGGNTEAFTAAASLEGEVFHVQATLLGSQAYLSVEPSWLYAQAGMEAEVGLADQVFNGLGQASMEANEWPLWPVRVQDLLLLGDDEAWLPDPWAATPAAAQESSMEAINVLFENMAGEAVLPTGQNLGAPLSPTNPACLIVEEGRECPKTV